MADIRLVGATVYAEEQTIENGEIQVSEGLIKQISLSVDRQERQENVIHLKKSWKLIPGFIDLHIHGTNGADVMDGKLEAIEKMQQSLPKEGTTSFLATTMTQSEEKIDKALVAVQEALLNSSAGAEVLGIHLEGPFISEEKAGAQPLSFIQPINQQLFNKWQRLANNQIRIVTFAPELEDGEAFIDLLSSQQVIPSLGHSNASYAIATSALEKGARQGTHVFNQMSPMHHRDVGLPGALLLNECFIEVIADGHHLSPEMVKLIHRVKGSKGIILITDSIRAKGLSDGQSELGGQTVYLTDGQARLSDGTLAGSTLTMIKAFQNIQVMTECSFEEAIQMASWNAAVQLGVEDRKGSLKIGKDADFVILDENNEVVMTFCRGECVYDHGKISNQGY